jgi:electron-transferring-flavoprotein dehydrogenase
LLPCIQDPVLLEDYREGMENSWAWYELEKVRNYRPGFRWGLLPGILHSGLLAYLTRGREPYTLKHR